MAESLVNGMLWTYELTDVLFLLPICFWFRYTQVYPPVDRELLLSWAGSHWKKGDPSASLPKPSTDHILLFSASWWEALEVFLSFSPKPAYSHVALVVGLDTKSHRHVGLSPTLSRHVAKFGNPNRSSVGSGAMPLLFLWGIEAIADVVNKLAQYYIIWSYVWCCFWFLSPRASVPYCTNREIHSL
jgi:hypothetical protein